MTGSRASPRSRGEPLSSLGRTARVGPDPGGAGAVSRRRDRRGGPAGYAALDGRQPVAGVAVWAHTGRGPHLSADQRRVVLETWREALPDRIIVAGARDITMAIEARRGRADACSPFPSATIRSGTIARLSRELPVIAFWLYEAAGGVAYDDATLHAILDLPGRHRHQGRHARLRDDLPAPRRPSSARHPDKLLITGEDRFLGYSLMLGARAALIGMGAALPDLQAGLLRAYADARLGRPSTPDPRSATGSPRRRSSPPMEGYVRRMLWAAAADGALPADACDDPWGPPLPRRGARRRSSARSAMRERLAADFERFGRALPRDAGSVRARGVRHRPHRALPGLRDAAPHRQGLGPALAQRRSARDRSRGRARLRGAQDRDRRGCRRASASMGAWAIHETRMKVERREPPTGGRTGWTVTWKGRGWDRSFDDYLALVRAAGDLTRAGALLAVPSVKYHLPRLDEPFRVGGYRLHHEPDRGGVGRRRRCRWRRTSRPRSPATRWPTSARGSSAGCARCRAQIRRAAGAAPLRLAIKLMNARFDDAFQREMLAAAAGADALVCFNRLWDAGRRRVRRLGPERAQPARAARGATGAGAIAAARRHRKRLLRPDGARLRPGRAARASSCTPSSSSRSREYPAVAGSRTQRALHALLFHPDEGLVAGMLELERSGVLHRRRAASCGFSTCATRA